MKENQPVLPTEQKTINLLKGLTFYRRLRRHGTKVEQFILALPVDVLDINTDTGTAKKFQIKYGFDETGKRVVVVSLDEFIYPDCKSKEVVKIENTNCL